MGNRSVTPSRSCVQLTIENWDLSSSCDPERTRLRMMAGSIGEGTGRSLPGRSVFAPQNRRIAYNPTLSGGNVCEAPPGIDGAGAVAHRPWFGKFELFRRVM